MVAALGAEMVARGRAASTLDLPADSSLPVTEISVPGYAQHPAPVPTGGGTGHQHGHGHSHDHVHEVGKDNLYG